MALESPHQRLVIHSYNKVKIMIRKSIIRLLGAALLVLPMAACGGDSSGGDFDDPVVARQELTSLGCDRAFECRASVPADLEPFFALIFGENAQACVTNLTPPQTEDDAVRAAIAEGRTTYHADRAETCYNGAAAATCEEFWANDETASSMACDTTFEGTIADGETCAVSVECVSQDCDEGMCLAEEPAM